MKVLNEGLVLIIALLAGLSARKRFSGFQRVIFLQLSVWIFFFAGSYVIILTQKLNGLSQNNHTWMNANLTAEFFILIVAARVFVKENKIFKALTALAMVLFCFAMASELAIKGTGVYANFTDSAAGFVITGAYGVLLYRAINQSKVWWKKSDVYICLGIFAYFAALVPIMSAFGYLNDHFPSVSKVLFVIINDTMANFRYLMVAIGFWLTTTNTHE